MILRTTLVALALLATPAQAAPVSYDEAVDGDLPLDPDALLNFEPGANIVKGTSFSGLGFDPDTIGFAIGADEELVSISYAWTFTSLAADTVSIAIDHALRDISLLPNFGFEYVVLFPSTSPSAMFTDVLPLGSGSYQVRPSFLVNSGSGSTWAYVWTFTVRSTKVPEPGAFGVLGLGFAGLMAARRRRA